MGAAYTAGAALRRGIEPRLAVAIALFAVGAFVAGVAAAWLTGRRGLARRPSARLAASLLVLTVLTVGFGAFFLFVAHAFQATAAWGRPFTLHWVGSMIVNGGASLIYTMAIALPLIIPFGLPVLLGAAIVAARPSRLSAAAPPVRPRAALETESSAP